MSSETFKCRCKCFEKCEPKRECECEKKRDCEHNHGKDCEWFEKALKEAYWRGFNDGCRKCRRKENECEEHDGFGEYDEYER